MSELKSASRLKNEGNALYGRGEYSAAYRKYTQAIQKNDKLAVLYSNRAACCLGMKRYIEAANDARKSTQVDPEFLDGWTRLAAALIILSKFPCSQTYWKKAVWGLNKDNLTLRQRQDYELWLTIARQEWNDLISTRKTCLSRFHVPKGSLPWDRALAVQPELARLGNEKYQSSVWVISQASHEWSEGVRIMRMLPMIAAEGPHTYLRTPNALDCLVGGILRDDRIFHVDDSSWFIDFNQLVTFDTDLYQAQSSELAVAVIDDARKRLQRLGWDAVRPSVAKTVRLWIMRGFVDGVLHQDYSLATEFVGRALDVLEWGRQTWPDVPEVDKGVVFSCTFIRGVRSLYLDVLMKTFADHVGEYTADALTCIFGSAEEVLRDLDIHPLVKDNVKDYDSGFESSFTTYTRGRALHAKAFYHRQLAYALENVPIHVREEHHIQAAKIYLEAADCYPVDDELHAWMLKCAVEDFRLCGLQHKYMSAILKRIKAAVPKMRRIWEYSMLAMQGRDGAIRKIMELERTA